jgi:hypothetical protein
MPPQFRTKNEPRYLGCYRRKPFERAASISIFGFCHPFVIRHLSFELRHSTATIALITPVSGFNQLGNSAIIPSKSA